MEGRLQNAMGLDWNAENACNMEKNIPQGDESWNARIWSCQIGEGEDRGNGSAESGIRQKIPTFSGNKNRKFKLAN
jgi:hypothetical protein